MIAGPLLVTGSLADVGVIRAVVIRRINDGRYRVVAFAGGPEFDVDAIDCWAIPCLHNRNLVRGLARGTGSHRGQS